MTGQSIPAAQGNPRPGRQLSADQKLSWLRLIRSENVGPATFRMLVNRYGTAHDALEALPELSARGGLRRRIKICSVADAEAEMRRAEKCGLIIVATGEPHYPVALAHIDGAPPLLFVRGRTDILTKPMVAIVGSRNCSAAGARIAAQFAEGLGAAGLVTVSGLARGIDGAAHKASLSGGTVAVLAGGADTVYPDEHVDLAAEISNTGALISERSVGYSPRGKDFPRRNRIISGISYGTIVVEAAKRSGTLITARFAGEQGRDVFAVPGSPLDPRSAGTNKLIKDGAQLVTEANDVVEALRAVLKNPDALTAPMLLRENDYDSDFEHDDIAADARDQVYTALGIAPVEIDEIIRHTGLPVGVVLMITVELELAGRLIHHPGQRVSLLPPPEH
ncbi:MAG: DNA-processing protein DprA [Fimbriimonadaceae bacterium]|nr:DNA-processing protein DprA [Alphaproteobacteria bacterium]